MRERPSWYATPRRVAYQDGRSGYGSRSSPSYILNVLVWPDPGWLIKLIHGVRPVGPPTYRSWTSYPGVGAGYVRLRNRLEPIGLPCPGPIGLVAVVRFGWVSEHFDHLMAG